MSKPRTLQEIEEANQRTDEDDWWQGIDSDEFVQQHYQEMMQDCETQLMEVK